MEGAHGTSLWRKKPIPVRQPMPAAFPVTAATIAGAEALDRLRHWPGEHRVAVGLSGGVDSSLTAALTC